MRIFCRKNEDNLKKVSCHFERSEKSLESSDTSKILFPTNGK